MSEESASTGVTAFGRERDVVPAIVETVAAATDRTVDDIRPLADVVDPDALDRLFEPDAPDHLQVTFRYEGFQVVVSGTGEVWLRDPPEGR